MVFLHDHRPSVLLPMRNTDYFFVHKTVTKNEYKTAQFTKVELAVLCSIQGYETVRRNMRDLPSIEWEEVRSAPRWKNALSLMAQMEQVSNEDFSEGEKGFCLYNNAPYFGRCYKMVGKDYFKVEGTKVPLGQRGWMPPEATVGGLCDFLSRLVRGAEVFLQPHYTHDQEYMTIQEFYKKSRAKPTMEF